MIPEPSGWKPGIEFYIDKSMGLCVIANTSDGTQKTKQYLKRGEAESWFELWIRETGLFAEERPL